MKKIHILLVLAIFSTKILIGQITNNEELYYKAFEKYCIQIDSFYIKYSRDPSNWKIIYLEKPYFFDTIPETINGKRVVILTRDNWNRIFKENHGTLIYLKINPIEIEDGLIKISFIPYIGHSKKIGHMGLEISCWTKIIFQYNCETTHWEYLKTENGGI